MPPECDIAPHRSALSAGLRCLPSKPFVHACFGRIAGGGCRTLANPLNLRDFLTTGHRPSARPSSYRKRLESIPRP